MKFTAILLFLLVITACTSEDDRPEVQDFPDHGSHTAARRDTSNAARLVNWLFGGGEGKAPVHRLENEDLQFLTSFFSNLGGIDSVSTVCDGPATRIYSIVTPDTVSAPRGRFWLVVTLQESIPFAADLYTVPEPLDLIAILLHADEKLSEVQRDAGHQHFGQRSTYEWARKKLAEGFSSTAIQKLLPVEGASTGILASPNNAGTPLSRNPSIYLVKSFKVCTEGAILVVEYADDGGMRTIRVPLSVTPIGWRIDDLYRRGAITGQPPGRAR